MNELNLHDLALEFHAKHPSNELAAIEAAMNIGAIAATEHAVAVTKETHKEINDRREKANRQN